MLMRTMRSSWRISPAGHRLRGQWLFLVAIAESWAFLFASPLVAIEDLEFGTRLGCSRKGFSVACLYGCSQRGLVLASWAHSILCRLCYSIAVRYFPTRISPDPSSSINSINELSHSSHFSVKSDKFEDKDQPNQYVERAQSYQATLRDYSR